MAGRHKNVLDGFFDICDKFLEKLGGAYYKARPGGQEALGRQTEPNHHHHDHHDHHHRRHNGHRRGE